MKFTFTLSMLLTFLISNSLFAQDPNVIVIIADDMGWSQVSTGLTNLNNPSDFYETPTLETLATEGIAFPNGYVNGGNCAPTRAAILSGQFAARPTNNVFNVYDLNRGNTSSNSTLIGPDMGLASNNNIDEIPSSAITIAETMKTAGYTTAHWGKYHVGENEASSKSNNAPTDQGFDYNYGGGTPGTPGAYFATSNAPFTFHGNIGPELDPYASPYTAAESLMLAGDNSLTGTPKHVTDAMADAAIDFMEAEKNTPFFMHFSNFAIHSPTGQSHARPDLYAKYVAKNSSNPSSMGHNNLGIAAILEGMDQTIGRLVDYLKTTDDPRNPGHKLSENTLVYFISDNGGAVNTQENGPLKGMKGEYTEGGIRSVTLAWSEAPWLANKGTVNTTPIVAFDLYPTLAEMAGASLPGGGYEIDGASQWQMLTNGTAMTREALFWHFPGYLIDSKRDSRPTTIARKGDYKLRYNYESLSYELYNLVSDIGESNNLLSGSPDQATLIIANDMSILLRNHLIDTSAPLPTYRSDGSTCPLPYIISTSGGAPNSQDGCQAVSGYAAYWDFDAAEGADDASENNHNPILTTGTLSYDTVDFQEGDQSLVFDGSTKIQYNDGTFLNASTSSRSVAVWIKPTTLSGIQEILDEGGNGNGLAIRLNNATLEAQITNNTDPDESVSATFPNDGDWHHIAMVFDGANTSLKLYIDGVLENTNASAFSLLDTHTSPGGIGGVWNNDAFNSVETGTYFTGKMDAFSVYDSVLSDTQIEEASCLEPEPPVSGCEAVAGYEAYWNFDVANGADDASGNGHDVYATVGSITYDGSDLIQGDQSVIFNGSSSIQYAQSGNGTFMMNALSARTFMAWVKPTNLVGLQNVYDEGGGTIGIAVRLNGTNLESVVRDSGTTSIEISAAFPNDGGWHHVALIYDGVNTSQKLYIDGVEVASGSAASSIGAHTGKGGIGGKISGSDSFKNTSNAFFTGKMDAFAVYDDVLNVTQVEEGACLSGPDPVVANAGADVSICEGSSTTLTASGGTSYIWSTGATTSSITVNPTATTTYSVTVSDGITSDSDDVIVTVNALPAANAGSDVTIVTGNSTTLTASGGDTYLWNTGATTSSITVSPTSTTVYSVTVTQNGCESTDEVQVTVNPLPVVANAGADVSICEGSSTTLTASGGTSYIWSTGATTSSITVNPTATTTYSVTVSDGITSDSDDVIVTVNALPTANAGSDVTIVTGNSTTLTASGGDTYLWNTGATTSSITVSPTSTTVYSVTVTQNGCDATDDVQVTVNPLPVVANAGADVSICEGSSTTLTATGGTSYTWSTGATTSSITVNPTATTTYSVTVSDGITSDSDDVIVTVNALPTANAGSDVTIVTGNSTTLTASGGDTYLWNSGATTSSITVSPTSTTVYSVTVTQNGCKSMDEVQVTVNPLPVVANAGADVSICEGSSTTLTATGGTSYIWSTGATTSSITVNPTATTTYSVTVSDGITSDSDDVIVTVNALPTANAGSDVTIVTGNSTTLTASGGDTYLWNSGATTSSITVSPTSTTVYSVTVTQNGCESMDEVQVTVNPLPVVANAGADVSICEGSSTTLTASGGTSYIWSTGATTSSITVSPSATTTYSVTVSDGITSDSDDVIVTVNALPTANAGSDVTIVTGNSTTLTASGGDTYLWNSGATTSSITVSPTSTTVYSVTVTQNGCESTDEVLVTVNPLPVVANAGADVSICEGSSTTLTATGGTSYIWSTGATTSSITVNPTATTTYGVTVSDGITSDSDDVIVTVNALPTANAGSDVTIDEGDFTILTATGGGTYLWNTGATTSSIVVSPISNTTYSVTVSQNGCSSIDDVTVTVNSVGCSYSVLNSEGFEGGWGIWNDGGSDARRSAQDAIYATSGTYCFRLRDNTSTSVATTDNLDLSAYEEITVDFAYYARSMDNSNEDFWLQISTNGGGSYTTVEEWNRDDEFLNNQFKIGQKIISGPFTSNTRLRFRCDASGNSDWVYIDDVVISGCSSSGGAKIVSSKNEEAIAINESDFGSEATISTSLFPNPFNSEMNIKIDGDYQKVDIRILNVLGQSLYFKSFTNKEFIQISTENFQSGQYLIRMEIDGKTIYKRAIKD